MLKQLVDHVLYLVTLHHGAIISLAQSVGVLSPGAVSDGEGDRVPAEPGGGEVFPGGGAVLPAPPLRELQAAVEPRPGGRLLHRQTQRWGRETNMSVGGGGFVQFD